MRLTSLICCVLLSLSWLHTATAELEPLCLIGGDPHILSWDMTRFYQFMDGGYYHLLVSPHLNIQGQFINCGYGSVDVMCLGDIVIFSYSNGTIDKLTIEVAMDGRSGYLQPKMNVQMNSKDTGLSPSYSDGDFVYSGAKPGDFYQLSNQIVAGYTLSRQGIYQLKIHVQSQAAITYIPPLNGMATIMIKPAASLLSNTCGLCGTLDGNPWNDLVDQSGLIHALTVEGATVSGRSWISSRFSPSFSCLSDSNSSSTSNQTYSNLTDATKRTTLSATNDTTNSTNLSCTNSTAATNNSTSNCTYTDSTNCTMNCTTTNSTNCSTNCTTTNSTNCTVDCTATNSTANCTSSSTNCTSNSTTISPTLAPINNTDNSTGKSSTTSYMSSSTTTNSSNSSNTIGSTTTGRSSTTTASVSAAPTRPSSTKAPFYLVQEPDDPDSFTINITSTADDYFTTNYVIRSYLGTDEYESADRKCEQHLITQQSAAWTMCMFDILSTNDNSSSLSAIAANILIGQCPSITDPSCISGTLFACRAACYGHGSCVGGTCQCDDGYTGSLCNYMNSDYYRSSSAGSVAGITVGLFVAVAIFVVVAIIVKRRRERQTQYVSRPTLTITRQTILTIS